MNKIKNSNGKVVGFTDITSTEIIISPKNHNRKVIITEPHLVKFFNTTCEIDQTIYKILYDGYLLNISEIASLFNISYFASNKIFKSLQFTTNKNQGRRNPSFMTEKSEETKAKIGAKSLGRISARKGVILSDETKKKISNKLKSLYREGLLDVSGDKQRKAWADGKYEGVAFGRGFKGHFSSLRFGQRFLFRSLLELAYILIWEESGFLSYYGDLDIPIQKIENESIRVPIVVNYKATTYTPDFFINDSFLVEIKSNCHLLAHPEDNIRFKQELIYASKYCTLNNLEFMLLTEKNINFEHKKFKKYLKSNQEHLVSNYNIVFYGKTPF